MRKSPNHDSLQAALELAASEGLVRLIIEEGPDVSRMARAAAEKLHAPAGYRLAISLSAPAPVRPARATGLTERETSVLRLLPSPSTVRRAFRRLNKGRR
jgi:hypothetical protein